MIYGLAYRNLFRRKTRTFLSVLGITIGIAMIVSLVSISEGLTAMSENLAESFGNNIWMSENLGAFQAGFVFGSLDIDKLQKVESLPGIEAVAPEVWLMADLEGYGGGHMGLGAMGVGIAGIDPERERKIDSVYVTRITQGRMFREGEKEVAVLGKKLIVGSGAKLGDSAKIKYQGREYKFRIVGVYETGQEEADDVFLVPLKDARTMKGLPVSRISAIMAKPTNPELVDSIARRIKLSIENVDVTYPRQMAEQFSGFIGQIKIVTYVITGIAALIGGIGVANTMIMSVLEQTKEIGVLKAVGWYSTDVLKMVIFESILISSMGAIAGIAIGASVAVFLLPAVFNGALTPVVTPNLLLNSMVFALMIGILGGIYPALRAARMDPVVAFGGR